MQQRRGHTARRDFAHLARTRRRRVRGSRHRRPIEWRDTAVAIRADPGRSISGGRREETTACRGMRGADWGAVRSWLAVLVLVVLVVACGDNVQPDPWLLDPIDASEGIWIRTPEFPVASDSEIQNCYFFEVPDLDHGADLWIDRTTLALDPGSHHMNVFRVGTIVNLDPAAGTPVDLGGVQGTAIEGATNAECWKSANWADWPLVTNSQQSAPGQQSLDWRLPDGVAARFHPGEQLMLQVHYVNASDQATPWVGRAGINLYRSHDGDTQELGTLFATQQRIRVCKSNPNPSYSGTCALPPGPHTVIGANGHFHARGRRFQIWGWDGTSITTPPDTARFYDNRDWNEPEMETGLDVALPEAGGVWWQCDYQWSEPSVGCDVVNQRDPLQANDCCYTFGPKVEASEHCNAFVYYYPRVDSGDITCF
jgi:hypothetical protein